MRSTSRPRARIPGLSVVVPVFDEEGSLERVLERTRSVVAKLAVEWELIVVDDGSRDRSGEIARTFAQSTPQVVVLSHPENRGFGAAQRTAFAVCCQPFVTLVPADEQLDPVELERLAEVIADTDIAIGVRSDRRDGAYRALKTRILDWTMRWVFGLAVRDVNWVKMYRRSALEKLELAADGIAIEAEILVKAKRLGLRMVEVGLGYRQRGSGVAKGDRFAAVMVTLMELFRLRLGLL